MRTHTCIRTDSKASWRWNKTRRVASQHDATSSRTVSRSRKRHKVMLERMFGPTNTRAQVSAAKPAFSLSRPSVCSIVASNNHYLNSGLLSQIGPLWPLTFWNGFETRSTTTTATAKTREYAHAYVRSHQLLCNPHPFAWQKYCWG